MERRQGGEQHSRLGHYLGDAASEMMSFKEIYLFIGESAGSCPETQLGRA